MMRWFYGHGLGFFLIPKIISLVVWVAIIVAIVYLVRNHQAMQSGGNRGNGSLDILRERYARGEISDDDFERMKSKLETK